MSAVLEAAQTADTDRVRRRPPTLNHYVRRDAILEGIVNGRPATAICGTRFVPRSQGGGEASAAGATLCPDCATRYGLLAD